VRQLILRTQSKNKDSPLTTQMLTEAAHAETLLAKAWCSGCFLALIG